LANTHVGYNDTYYIVLDGVSDPKTGETWVLNFSKDLQFWFRLTNMMICDSSNGSIHH